MLLALLVPTLAVHAVEQVSWGALKSVFTSDGSGGAGKKAGKSDKADICHYSADDGLFHLINIGVNAVNTHFANHGDLYPGTYFIDADGDGYGNPTGATVACPSPGFVVNALDSNDADASINPDADEVCGDGIDNNSDGQVDENCSGGGCGGEMVCQTNPDLSNIGAGDFSIRFAINTAQTGLVAVLAQRATCFGTDGGPGGWWSLRLVDGRISIETAGPYGAGYTYTQSSGTVTDGQTHEVLVERRSGTLTITVDCVLAGTGTHTAAFGTLSDFGNPDGCLGADGTVALSGALSDVCIATP